MRNSTRKGALQKSLSKTQFLLDDAVVTHRRNLLSFSIIAFALTIIQPAETNPVNFGFIRGSLINDNILFWCVNAVCIYQMLIFYLSSSKFLVKEHNIQSLEKIFMSSLAVIEANKCAQTGRNEGYVLPPLGEFSLFHNDQKDNSNWQVSASIPTQRLEGKEECMEYFTHKFNFQYKEETGVTHVIYSFVPTDADYKYMVLNRHLYRVHSAKAFFEYWLPFLIGLAACMALNVKVIY